MSAQEQISRQTVLHEWHVSAGASMHEFGGFDMPIHYQTIMAEHLGTRAHAGLFDISHMGRFWVRGAQAVPFLRRALTNDAAHLSEPGWSHYTILADENGCALDDTFLYRVDREDYLLVVNGANHGRDWAWLQELAQEFPGLQLEDRSQELAMLALQGPAAMRVLNAVVAQSGASPIVLPERNAVGRVRLDGADVIVARTGYTGEPVSLELFPATSRTVDLWERILEAGREESVLPVGLGARDTLRLEAGLPLYGHELGEGPDGQPIPIMALLSMASRAVNFADPGRQFVGREALARQLVEVDNRGRSAPEGTDAGQRRVPYLVRRLAVLDKRKDRPGNNPVRQGHRLLVDEQAAGWVTSGTVVPCWRHAPGTDSPAESIRRAIALAYVRADLRVRRPGTPVSVDKGRGRPLPALLVRTNLRVCGDHTRAVLYPGARLA